MHITQTAAQKNGSRWCWSVGIRRARIVFVPVLAAASLLSIFVCSASIVSMLITIAVMAVTAANPLYDKLPIVDRPTPAELPARSAPDFVVAEEFTVLVYRLDWGGLYSIIRSDVAAHGGFERNDRKRDGRQFVVPADYVGRLADLSGTNDRTRYRRWAKMALESEATPQTPDTEVTIVADTFLFHRIWLRDTLLWAGIAAAAGVLLGAVFGLLCAFLYPAALYQKPASLP